ncbi:hypothetical protein CK203_092720 [Vitis vinifera]|uniref:Uncharacterized protein n=1 Tax=Vitis vinifera TaxID=29760 RepID=A0A438D856_VITVI|nr:hypothetical protein CK203_092720 [Vitis vinifera]
MSKYRSVVIPSWKHLLVDELITFPPIKPNRVRVPHEDALILTLSISGFSMHKILVDPGSSTDKQMGHSLVTLESTGRILIKLNGATTVSLGNMVLLVEVEPLL